MDTSLVIEAGLVLAGVCSSSGALVLAVRTMRKDVNGLGKKVRALDEREDRRHREVVAMLYESREPQVRECARTLLLDK